MLRYPTHICIHLYQLYITDSALWWGVTGPGTESQLAAILAQVIRQCAVLDTMVMYHTRCQRSRLLLTGPGHHSCQSWSGHLPQRKDMITTSDLVIKSLRFDGHVKRNRQWNFVFFFGKAFAKKTQNSIVYFFLRVHQI